MIKKKRKFYDNVMWFSNRRNFDIDFFEYLQPQRQVSYDPKYKSGLYYSEKCQRDIQYESGLELKFIEQLEKSKDVIFYYEQPVKIKYPQGKIKREYTCDFGIYFNTKEFVLVEIKELSSMLEDRVQLKAEALIEYCSNKGFGFLFTDGEHTFNDLLKKLRKVKNNYKLEKRIISYLETRPLRKREYNIIAKECNAKQNELLKIILKHDLRYKAFPFRLQHGKFNNVFRQVFYEKKKYDELGKDQYKELFKRGYPKGSSTNP